MSRNIAHDSADYVCLHVAARPDTGEAVNKGPFTWSPVTRLSTCNRRIFRKIKHASALQNLYYLTLQRFPSPLDYVVLRRLFDYGHA